MKRTLIVLAAALAALALILMKKNSAEKSMSKDSFVLDTAWRAEIGRFEIAKQTDTARLEKKDGKWVVARDGFPVDTGKVAKALGYLVKLQDREKVSESKERLSEYGLDSAEAKHVVLKDGAGKSVEVAIGKTSGADYASTYWKWEGKPAIYRTPGNFSWELGVKEEDWKDRKLFPGGAKDLKFVEVEWRDTTGKSYAYKLESITDTTWKMLAPVDSSRVKNNLANEMAVRFGDMSIDEFSNPKDTNMAKVKLDTPMVWLKFGLKNGATRELKTSKLLEGYAYAKHPDRQDTVKISSWRLEPFKKMPFDLLEAPPPPKPDSAQVQSGAPDAGGIKIEPSAPGKPAAK